MTCCKVQLLGSFSITINDIELVHLIPGGKAKLLLAYLVLSSDMPQNRKKIAFDFWPDSTDKQALSNLRKLLHDLQKRVPQIKPYLKITSTYIQWNYDYPFYLDVHKFEEYANGLTPDKLHEAEALYKGELLPGFYEEWLNEKREQLAHTYSDMAMVYAAFLVRTARCENLVVKVTLDLVVGITSKRQGCQPWVSN